MSPMEQALAPLQRMLNPLVGVLNLDQAGTAGSARQLMAEVLGTFGLVLFCAGSAHVNWWSGGQLGALGVGLVNGFGVAVMIFAFWAISGAHLNPAVSLGLWLSGKLPVRKLAPYVAAQLVGALIASSVMHGLFRNHTGEGDSWLGANFSTGPLIQAFGTEIVITFFLVYAILMMADRGRSATVFAVAVGLYVAAAVTMAGSVSGASMNPARAFGPAAIAWFWDNHWVYWVAPGIGAVIASVFHTVLRDRSNADVG